MSIIGERPPMAASSKPSTTATRTSRGPKWSGNKIIQIDDRSDAFGWSARITVGLDADAKVAVAALLDRLWECGKPGRQPDAETEHKIRQYKPPSIEYDDDKSVDPWRAANYLEEKLPKPDRILAFDGGHAAMVTCKALSSPGAENGTSVWTPERLCRD